MATISPPTSASEKVATFAIKWAPRAVVVAVGGYYGLGIAYELSLMALIDQVAIQAIKHVIGYAGVGALMPTVQWYSAWGARIAIGFAAGIIYDFAEKGIKACWVRFTENRLPPSLTV